MHATPECTSVAMQGSVESLQMVLPNVRYLGLSNNLLWSWEHIHQIATSLPGLQALDVSFNRLTFMHSPNELSAYAGLRILVAKGCDCTWQDVISLGSIFTGLEELYISSNRIDAIEYDVTASTSHSFNGLKVLDITDNSIKGWNTAAQLSHLPLLSCLKLSGNTLNSISLSGAHITVCHTGLNHLLPPAEDQKLTVHCLLQARSSTRFTLCCLLTAESLTGLP